MGCSAGLASETGYVSRAFRVATSVNAGPLSKQPNFSQKALWSGVLPCRNQDLLIIDGFLVFRSDMCA